MKTTEESSYNLLPCPFCGEDVDRCPCIKDDPTTDCNRIACKHCGMEVVWNTEDYAYNVDKWNKRSHDSPPGCHIEDACMNYSHDYGLLCDKDRENMQFQATEWLRAWIKAWGWTK